MNEFKPIRFETECMEKYARLFEQCFPANGKFNQEYLRWLYVANPLGCAIGFDAWNGNEIAAHYVTVPMEVEIEGRQERVLLSLNTATHPNYQGRGLFTKLAELTYEAAASHGFHSVYGIANANSTPGFVRKLGFQLVEPLAAKVGIGSLGVDFSCVRARAQFRATWTDSSLAWRCANPNNPVTLRRCNDRLQVYAPAMGSGLPAYAELAFDQTIQIELSDRPSLLSPMRLYLGLEPKACPVSRRYVDIPQRFRPSPLNLIYKPLVSSPIRLDPGHMSLSFIDFDAY